MGRKIKIKSSFILAITLIMLLSVGIIPDSFAQTTVPDGLNYQGTARDADGYPISNQEIVVEITILSGDESGTIEWQESHTVETEESGFFSFIIGEGTPTGEHRVGKEFKEISWDEKELYLRVRVDFGFEKFGNGLVDIGTSKFQSVPYAFMSRYSAIADTALKAPTAEIPELEEILDVDTKDLLENAIVYWDGTGWVVDTLSTGSGSGTIPDIYLKTDGSKDLTGDWEISENSISLGTGDIALTEGDVELRDGNVTITNGSIDLTNGNISLTSGDVSLPEGTLDARRITGNSLVLESGSEVDDISDDETLGGNDASDEKIVTQKAIKDYIDANVTGGNWTLDGSYLYNINQNIGIGTATPKVKFHAAVGTDGFLVTGTHEGSSASISSLGVGTRMAFYPAKSAFRAGRLKDNSTYWDNSSLGQYSAAIGLDVKAEGDYSIALGHQNQSTNTASFSVGQSNIAGGVNSAAIGKNNSAEGVNSFCANYANTSEGDNSFAIGSETMASGDGAFAGGYATESDGEYSLAFGNEAYTSSYGDYSVAFGGSTSTYGVYSIASGYKTNAYSFAEVVIGQYNTGYSSPVAAQFTTWRDEDRVFVIGNGSSSSNRSDALTVWKNGNVEINGTLTSSRSSGPSDRRLKKNIRSLNLNKDDVLKMEGVYFNWRTDEFPERHFETTTQVGFIAQDVELLFPELVETDNRGYKSIDYTKITVLLVEAVKQQQQEIDSLKAENKKIKNDNTNLNLLKTQLEQLEQRVNLIDAQNSTTGIKEK